MEILPLPDVRRTSSTESLKKSLLDQSNHPRQPVLQHQTLEELFESCVDLCKSQLEKAMVSAKISTDAKTYFHPIARQIDDELLRLELWAFEVGTKDGLRNELSATVTADVAMGTLLRKFFGDLNASLENIRTNMELISNIL